MSRVYAISDLHLKHKNLVHWWTGKKFKTIEEHDEWLVESINSVVTKRDTLWILGDIAWNNAALKLLGEIKGYKKLLLGNHDGMKSAEYAKYGRLMPGLVKYKNFWLSHCPIHPDELRGMRNIHGHVHHNPIPDDRYLSVCVETLNGIPLDITEMDGRV